MIIEVLSSNSISEHINGPLNSYSISNNKVSNKNSSVLNEIFKFLRGGRYNNYNTREWRNFCKLKTKNGALSDTRQ